MKWLLVAWFCILFSQCNASYNCDYTMTLGMSIVGPTIHTSVQASAAAGEDCAAQCCNIAECYGSTWSNDSAECWFLDNETVHTYKPEVSVGIELWIINSKSLCKSDCPQNVTGNLKRGLAYSFPSSQDMSAIRRGVHWWYNWAPTPNSTSILGSSKDLGMEFVPMIWNSNFKVNDIISNIPSGSKYILVFNEPNFFSQGNVSPTQAATLWPQIEQIAQARNLLIVGPAVNYCGPSSDCWETDPYAYLDAFFAACSNCRVDYVAAHLYSCSPPFLNHYIGGFRKYNRSLWLTEFSCGDQIYTEQEQLTYMQQALAILDADPHIFRYSWFSGRTQSVANANLLGDTGVLTELGVVYTTQNLADDNGSERYSPFTIWNFAIFLVFVEQ